MMGQFAAALQDLDRADVLKPNNAFCLRGRGATLRQMGQYAAALGDLDRADALEPDNAFTHQTRGAVRWRLGGRKNLEAALRDLDNSLRLYSKDDGDVLAFRAAVKLDLGDSAGALLDATAGLHALQQSTNPLPETLELCQSVIAGCNQQSNSPLRRDSGPSTSLTP